MNDMFVTQLCYCAYCAIVAGVKVNRCLLSRQQRDNVEQPPRARGAFVPTAHGSEANKTLCKHNATWGYEQIHWQIEIASLMIREFELLHVYSLHMASLAFGSSLDST
jgi:hypothetical protein